MHLQSQPAQRSRSLPAPIGERIALIRHVALDMDGTIYSGDTLFASTAPFLAALGEMGIGYTFLTNNSSKSACEYLSRLNDIGIKASADQLYTSTMATVQYLNVQCPQVRRLFVLGTRSMRDELAAADFEIVSDSPEDAPDAVIVGFDTELSYSRLCRAAHWIKEGKPFVATHPDRVCPTDAPTVLVDCGAICSALQAATGRAPDMVLGKPDPCMIRGILCRHSLRPENLAMVGDRLYTDIAMARKAGALGVLVLTGETNGEQAAVHEPAPDLIVPDLAELGRKLRAVRGDSISR
jgi:HAD superfamily hydrolase (TIGR01450 family)